MTSRPISPVRKNRILGSITLFWGICGSLILLPTLTLFPELEIIAGRSSARELFLAITVVTVLLGTLLLLPAGICIWRGSPSTIGIVHVAALLWTCGICVGALDAVLVVLRNLHVLMLFGFIWPVILLVRYQPKRENKMANTDSKPPKLPPLPGDPAKRTKRLSNSRKRPSE